MSINVNDKNLGHATAYAYYKAGGGTMTEAEFTEFMADFGTASQTAVEAAQAALASKNAAQTAATTATTKASEAATSATTATTAAEAAQADADAAALDASQAMSAASTATTKATEATTAAATAVSAKDDAVSANTAAQSAKTAAQTAQTGAETAAASVQSSAAQIQTNADDISQLKSDLNIIRDASFTTENISLSNVSGSHYWNIETSQAVFTLLSGSEWSAYQTPIQVNEGEIYSVKGIQGATHKTRIWVITDDDYNIISMADDYYSTNETENEDMFVVPENGKYLLLTSRPYPPVISVKKYSPTKNIAQTDIQFQQQSGWLIDSGYAVLTDLAGSNWCASSIIDVEEGQTYTAKGVQGNSHKVRVWALVNDDMQVVLLPEDAYGYSSVTTYFTVPEGATKLVLTGRNDSNYVELVWHADAFEYADKLFSQKNNPLSGKKLSLLGDSISAYAGTIPSGNTAYYTGANSGVTSPDQMWWKVLCDKTGMIPLVINGWSGSGINWQTDSSHVNIVPMSDDTRCNGLHDGTTKPDVILIAGGVNDYTYAEYAQNEPLAWDGKTVPTYTEPSTGKKVYNSFTEAYVAMIKKLQTNYPDAIIVALSTWFTMRGNDNGYTLTHAVGQNVYTQQEYNDKIRYVAEQMHIPYIDVSNIGFNRNNFYPTYASDSSTIPTHPNKVGQGVMGRAIASKLPEAVKGYLS